METFKTIADAKSSMKGKDSGFNLNPKHKGYCTPMTKKTCTGKRKAFAMTMKKHHGFASSRKKNK